MVETIEKRLDALAVDGAPVRGGDAPAAHDAATVGEDAAPSREVASAQPEPADEAPGRPWWMGDEAPSDEGPSVPVCVSVRGLQRAGRTEHAPRHRATRRTVRAILGVLKFNWWRGAPSWLDTYHLHHPHVKFAHLHVKFILRPSNLGVT